MKHKIQFMLLFFIMLIFVFPTIGFSKSKEVMGEYCDIYKGEVKDKKSLDEFKKTVSVNAKDKAIKKLIKEFRTANINSDCVSYATNNLLEKVVVLKHTESAEESGRNICEKVKITYQPDVISKYLNQESCLKGWGTGKEPSDWSNDIHNVMPTKDGKLNVGFIVESKIPNIDDHQKETLEEEEEKQFYNMAEIYKDNYNVLDKSAFFKAAEQHKVSLYGITENEILQLGRDLNLDVIVHRVIHKDSRTTKVRKINTGKVLLSKSYETAIAVPESASASAPEPETSDWIKYGKDKRGTLHYYKKGFVDKDNNIVKVLNKWVFSKREKADAIQYRRESRQSTRGYEKLSHMVFLSEIDCQNQSERILYLFLYDTNDKSLYSNTFKNPEWEFIQPDSNAESILKAVCK